MNELEIFLEISGYAGSRFDLVQAGGGNSSVKLSDGTMYIKSSGIYLSEVTENSGFCIVNNKKILEIFDNKKIFEEEDKIKRNKIVQDYISQYNLTKNNKPSIETLMHSLLKKYTLHTHPIVVNIITCRKNWKEVLSNLFGENVIFINYNPPGIELALEIKKHIKNKQFQIIFLQNHGLVVTSDNKEDIRNLTEFVLNKIETYLQIDMSKYKITEEISKFYDNKYNVYLSEDILLNKMISSPFISSLPFCPDKIVYCGVKVLKLGQNPKKDIQKYINEYSDIPKVIIYKEHLFFVAKNIKNAKAMESVLKFHVLSLSFNSNQDINYLQNNEIKYIINMEEEKYRNYI